MKISDRMMVEPYFEEVHEDLSVGGVGFEELVGFDFPLFSELVGDLFHENGVLVESILILLVFKEGEIGVIENMIFLFPDEVVSSLLSGEGLAPCSILFVLHL